MSEHNQRLALLMVSLCAILGLQIAASLLNAPSTATNIAAAASAVVAIAALVLRERPPGQP